MKPANREFSHHMVCAALGPSPLSLNMIVEVGIPKVALLSPRYNMTTGKYKDAATSFSQVKPQDTVQQLLSLQNPNYQLLPADEFRIGDCTNLLDATQTADRHFDRHTIAGPRKETFREEDPHELLAKTKAHIGHIGERGNIRMFDCSWLWDACFFGR